MSRRSGSSRSRRSKLSLPSREPFTFSDVDVAAGTQATVELPVARLLTGTQLPLTAVIVHGAHPGPKLWLDAAIHGDELNGIRVIRDVMRQLDAAKLHGTVVAVPVVNVFGLVHRSRYLPDRRDLNRSFPGTPRGSLASRLANLFLEEVVKRCEIGIDLHTAGPNRNNLPHVRGDIRDLETRRLAEAFGSRAIFGNRPIEGSLRRAALDLGRKVLVFEAGEPERFNRGAIDAGVSGVLRVLDVLGMWPSPDLPPAPPPLYAVRSSWLRAGRSGVFNARVRLGDEVTKGQLLGSVSDPLPMRGRPVKAPFDGLVLGIVANPLVHQGEALIHLVEVASEPTSLDQGGERGEYRGEDTRDHRDESRGESMGES